MRAALACACTAVSLGMVGQASANPIKPGGGAPVDKLTIDVRATIASRCGFAEAPRSPPHAFDLNAAQHVEIPFTLDCNTPFTIGVKSDHGGLTSDRAPDGSGFAFSKPYQVALEVGTDASALTPDPCGSEELVDAGKLRSLCAFYGDRPGQGLSSGKSISTFEPSHLVLSWPGVQDGTARNVAGRYHDTITITVSARA